MKPMLVRLPVEQHDALMRLAAERGDSAASIIRTALRYHLKRSAKQVQSVSNFDPPEGLL